MGSKAILGRYVHSQINVFVKGGNRCFGYSLGFSWLWGHFEGLKFGIQGTTYGVCGGEIGLQFLERKQDILFLVLEAQNWFASKSLSISQQLKFGKNRNPYGNM
jgi:hypothetical protein